MYLLLVLKRKRKNMNERKNGSLYYHQSNTGQFLKQTVCHLTWLFLRCKQISNCAIHIFLICSVISRVEFTGYMHIDTLDAVGWRWHRGEYSREKWGHTIMIFHKQTTAAESIRQSSTSQVTLVNRHLARNRHTVNCELSHRLFEFLLGCIHI